METALRLRAVRILCICCCLLIAPASQGMPELAVPTLEKASLVFEPNNGQADPRILWLSRGSGYVLLFTDHDARLLFQPGDGPQPIAIASSLQGSRPCAHAV